MHRWELEDFCIYNFNEIASEPDFEIRAQKMEELTMLFLDIFFLRMQPMLSSISRYKLYLVRESKLNYESQWIQQST
jgi:hypothetical protein